MKEFLKRVWNSSFYIGEAEITTKEIVFSFVIVAVMVISGIKIGNAITSKRMEKIYAYQTALQINDNYNSFVYNMKTNVGKTLVYSTAKVVDPVPCFEMGGGYGRVKREEEHYNPHTRVVTHTDGNGHTYTTTETYWTWDHYHSDYDQATTINFCGVDFDYGKLAFGELYHIETVKFARHKRYVYYGSPTETAMTIFTTLSDNTINNTEIYEEKTIEEVLINVNHNPWLIVFYIVWALISCMVLYVFYCFDNYWLR